LDQLLDRQFFRLRYWKYGVNNVNYRRFFDNSTLAALRMEDPRVFAATHRLLKTLLEQRKISGLRIDHIDGLWAPEEYLERLHALAQNHAGSGTGPYVLVEKILTASEDLPASWPVHGT